MARARHATAYLTVVVLATMCVIPRVGAFSGGPRVAITRPHDGPTTASSASIVRPSCRNAAAVPAQSSRRLSSPSLPAPLLMASMDFSDAAGPAGAAGAADSTANQDPDLLGSPGDHYVKCGKCQACYPMQLEVLGRGRTIECSVCGNKWFQTSERALTLTENFLMKEWSEDRAKDAAEGALRFAGFDLFVGNIPFSVSEKDLGAIFGNFGEVKSTTLVTDDYGDSKGYGFVKMGSSEDGQKAIMALNGIEIQGRSMLVKVGAGSAGGMAGGRGRGRGGGGGGYQGRGGGGGGGYQGRGGGGGGGYQGGGGRGGRGGGGGGGYSGGGGGGGYSGGGGGGGYSGGGGGGGGGYGGGY
eukprot:jgi/Undpi1/9845/HiC_scaffold_28.g12299.m1